MVNSAVSKGQSVNENIASMKEYQEKVASLNSCWRTKNRAQLVSNLQHENRQIIALGEENRQLRFALKELEEGMHMIMNDYRKTLSGMMRSETLSEAGEALNKNTFVAGIDFEKYVGIARVAESFASLSEQKIIEDQALISQLRTENQALRGILHGIPLSELNLNLDLTSVGSANTEQSKVTSSQQQT